MKNRYLIAPLLILGLAVSGFGGFTGFDTIRLSGNGIEDSGGTERITFATSGTNITLTGKTSLTGIVVQPGQPSFLAHSAAELTNATGDGTSLNIEFATEIYDTGSVFAASTFTATVDGVYLFNMIVQVGGLSTANHSSVEMNLITSNNNFGSQFSDISTSLVRKTISYSVVTSMDANDTAHVRFKVEGSSKVVDILSSGTDFTTFSATLIN